MSTDGDTHAGTRARWTRRSWIAGILVAWISFTYVPHLGGWVAPLGTLVMVGCGLAAWGHAARSRLGLRVSGRAAVIAVLLLVATAAAAWALIHLAADAARIKFLAPSGVAQFLSRGLHTAAQTLNEEIVLGALLLGAVTRMFPRSRAITISIGVAAVFAFLHLAFYAFRPEDAVNHGYLSPLTLLTVFGVGVLRNNLILARGHIAFAWAVHFGWNFFFMGGRFTHATTGVFLDEPARFNLVLGHPATAALILLAAACTAWPLGHAGRDGRMA